MNFPSKWFTGYNDQGTLTNVFSGMSSVAVGRCGDGDRQRNSVYSGVLGISCSVSACDPARLSVIWPGGPCSCETISTDHYR